MTTNWQNIYILCCVLSLGISCAADTHAPHFTRRKKGLKPSPPKSKLTKVPITGARASSRSPAAAGASPPGPHSVSSAPSRSVRPDEPAAHFQADFAPLPDVSVTCAVSDFVVRVKPSFYGLGADVEELRLGRSCKSNGVLRPYGDLLFTYPLTACGAVREVPHGYLVYKFVLHYEPSQKRFPSRMRRIDVDIECRYQRHHHVHQLAVKPTWQTAVLRKRLKARPSDFHIQLMDDSWSEPADTHIYHIGEAVNFQISASRLRKSAKLYISSCYASPSNGVKSFLKYTIVDNLGCMMDSKTDPGASRFISRTDGTIRFSIKAFQFTADPDTEISIHCKLSVTSEDPGPAHKSCTYQGNGWKALTGDDSMCDCCDSQCLTSKRRRAAFEGSASIGLLVSDQSLTSDVGTKTEETRTSPPNDELHGWENLWETANVVNGGGGGGGKEEQDYVEEVVEEDEESRVALGGMTESGLEELGFSDWGLLEKWDATGVGSNEFGERGPRPEAEDFIEGEEQEEGSEVSEAEQEIHLNQNGDVVLHLAPLEQPNAGTQSDLALHKSKEQGENLKYTEDELIGVFGGEREDSDLADPSDDGEMSWYFTWR